jgi:lipopolysaccharide transport system permease protein
VRVAVAYASGRHIDMAQLGGMAIKAVPWAFFVGCLSAGTASLVSNMSLVTKIYFPREVLPLSSVLAQSFDSLIGGVFVALLLPFLGVTASVQLLWLPVLLLLLWCFALGSALFLSRANLFFRDVKYLVQVFLTFGIFITPVILDAPMFGPVGSRIMMLNPVAPILEGLRLSVVQHHNLLQPLNAPAGFLFWRPWYLAYVAAWAFGGLLVSVILFHRAERRFAEVA